ncbi:outer membrane protein OmpA-like peptidoglycan-associated protein [Flavobacteriaceae bacterium MAR_2009_75]|nr:outer membrane protein OmpA-like peptidoglycan-associated protein [Flavobacteriaceae bacterium MAR_2009_75]
MIKKITILLGITLITSLTAYSQSKKVEKAENEFDKYAYQSAIESYEDLVADGFNDEEIFKNLGNANYLNAQYEEASSWYSKLFMIEDADIEPEYMYRYAQSLKSTGEYTAADTWMKKFDSAQGDDVRAKKFANQQDYLNKIENLSGRYDIQNISINSPESDFAPSLFGKNLVFSTARDTGTTSRNIHEWTNRSFLNLYRAGINDNGTFSSASKLPKTMNKKTHESSTSFTKDGSVVYFTRNNSQNGKFARDEKGVSRLKIYRADIDGEEWTNIQELPFNSDSYSTAHPSLSADETKLYFASDMEGSIGASDIFVVDINGDGTYGSPKNMGDIINTEARETFPFISQNNVLYFASDGHPGLGGLDIFAVQVENDETSEVLNIGKPVNSEQDDFSFIINESSGIGFFASNRAGGQGGDDIYSLQENVPLDFSCSTVVSGTIKGEDGFNALSDARVSIMNSKNEVVATTTSDENGNFTLDGNCEDGEYKLIASKSDYDDVEKMFATVNSGNTNDIKIVLKKSIKQAPTGTNLIVFLNLRPIYFDLDKDIIRPDASDTMQKVIDYMKQFPTVKVQVQSHTDSKASTAYNKNLSERRAKNTVTYLVANGIEESRITGKGFGESQLTNDCKSRKSCPDERHQENRRSEFIVIE